LVARWVLALVRLWTWFCDGDAFAHAARLVRRPVGRSDRSSHARPPALRRDLRAEALMEYPLIKREGGCMCGAVRYEADFAETFNACFCKMCQRWASGMFMGAHTVNFKITKGEGDLSVFKSSDWAQRGFCAKCGSNLYYHAPEFGDPSVALGSLDDTDDVRMAIQFYVDQQPQGLEIANETKKLTGAETEKLFTEA
jgi:hypothetical protein